VPYLELGDGRVIVASDGADRIEVSEAGKSLRVSLSRWALIGAKPGQLVDPHLTSEVEWHLDGSVLTREETLTASETLTIRGWSFALPTTASRVASIAYEGQKWSRLESADGILEVQSPTSSWPIEESVVASGDAPIGRGARRPVPLHLNYEARNIR